MPFSLHPQYCHFLTRTKHLYKVELPTLRETLVILAVETSLTEHEDRATGTSPNFHIDP
jgi:hypothetical protein